MALKKIAFGGGCFWYIEGIFNRIEGVIETVIGYGGGENPNPSYLSVSADPDGHAEVVLVTYDDRIVRLEYLLNIFFLIHNPTKFWNINNKKGPLYRSVILFTEEFQRIDSLQSINERTKDFQAPILTEVLPFKNFNAANIKYQNYYQQHPEKPFCKNIILPKIIKIEKQLIQMG